MDWNQIGSNASQAAKDKTSFDKKKSIKDAAVSASLQAGAAASQAGEDAAREAMARGDELRANNKTTPQRFDVPALGSFKRGGVARKGGKYKLHKGERAVKRGGRR